MRENLEELFATHRNSIDELRRRVADVLPADPLYDDLWLLRFCLTHSKKGSFDAAAAEDAARKTVQWRTANASVLAETAATEKYPHQDTIRKFMLYGRAGCVGGNEPVAMVRIGHTHPKGLLQALPLEDLTHGILCSREWMFRWCHERTKATGTMVRNIIVWDMQGAGFHHYDSKMMGALKKASELSAVYYPQLNQNTVVLGMPPLASKFVRAIFATFPASVRDKLSFCPKTPGTSAGECPWIKNLGGDASCVPPFVGGTMECPVALLAREEDKDALTRSTIPARTSKNFDYTFPIHGKVAWELLVEEYGIEMSLTFYEDLNPEEEMHATAERPYEPVLGQATVLLAATKFKSENGLKSGEVELPKTNSGKGVVRLTLDNSYSMLRSKTLQYRVVVRHADEGASDAAAPAGG